MANNLGRNSTVLSVWCRGRGFGVSVGGFSSEQRISKILKPLHKGPTSPLGKDAGSGTRIFADPFALC